MPQRLTLGDIRASRIPQILNLTSTDTRLAYYVNEAIERLLAKGKWVGTTQKYQICVYSGCLTWPRQFETIESVAICGFPIQIRNEWFEFNEMGWGLRDEGTGTAGTSCRVGSGCGSQLLDRGMAVSFEDIRGTDKKIKVYCDIEEGPTPDILLQGYNEDGNWIRTLVDGDYVDGEYVTPTGAGTLTTNFFTSLTGVQKPITKGSIRLYEYNTTASTQRPLAFYEYDETRPVYRRSLIPGLSNRNSCPDNEDETCNKKTVTVIAKMAFLPVRQDTDWLLISSIPALRAMCQALRKEENNLWDEAKKYEANAIQILDEQLQAFMGDSEIIAVRMPHPSVYGSAVANVI